MFNVEHSVEVKEYPLGSRLQLAFLNVVSCASFSKLDTVKKLSVYVCMYGNKHKLNNTSGHWSVSLI